MAIRRGREGGTYRRLRRRIQEETTNCWRCGKAISNQYRWPHPLSVTVGHYIALEDGGEPEDPSNMAGECIPCNQGDGARRTNAKRSRQPTTNRKSYRNGRW